MLATIITDASFCSETKAAGWAAWIRADGGIKVTRSGSFKDRPKQAEEAELWALKNGAFLAAQIAGVTHLLVQSDCLGALRKMPATYEGLPVRTRHVKGHTNNPAARSWVNRWCDREAKKHMKKERVKE